MRVFWISMFASALLTLPLLAAVQQIQATIRLYKRVPLVDAVWMLRYTVNGRNALILLLPLVSVGIFCLVLAFRHIEYPKAVLLPVLLLHMNALFLYGTPPSVLLLGSSRWESIRLFNLVERGVYPYRVVVLLEPSRTQPHRHSPRHWLHFEVDNLRILGPHSWRDVVHRISATVPVVVLDTRLASPAVCEETEHILSESLLLKKTLLVVNEDRTAPSVVAIRQNRSAAQVRKARMREVVPMLKKMGLAATTSPDDNPLLAQASFAQNSKKLERGMMAVARTGVPFAIGVRKDGDHYGGTQPSAEFGWESRRRRTGGFCASISRRWKRSSCAGGTRRRMNTNIF